MASPSHAAERSGHHTGYPTLEGTPLFAPPSLELRPDSLSRKLACEAPVSGDRVAGEGNA